MTINLVILSAPSISEASRRTCFSEVAKDSCPYNSCMPDLASHYLDEIRRQMRGYKRLAESAFAQIDDRQFFVTLDPESNSVAILIKHMAGNMRSRFTDLLTSDGEKPDRHRDTEFEISPATTRDDLIKTWEAGWARVFDTIQSLTPDDLLRPAPIRGEPHSVLQALNRALAHYAQHGGQIVFLCKHLRSSEWQTLSVPRGKSEEFNAKMVEKHGPAK